MEGDDAVLELCLHTRMPACTENAHSPSFSIPLILMSQHVAGSVRCLRLHKKKTDARCSCPHACNVMQSCTHLSLTADAANVPGIDDMRIATESSGFSSWEDSDSSSNSTEGSSADEEEAATSDATGVQGNADPGNNTVNGTSNVIESQHSTGSHAKLLAPSAQQSNKRRRIVTASEDQTQDQQDQNASSNGDKSEETSVAESDTRSSSAAMEYVYPAYLREGPGRDLLALALEMRNVSAEARPSWSRILQGIREAGSA